MKRSRHLAVIEFAPKTSKATALAAFPSTRGDCEDGPRPCPWARCRHHLGVDVLQGPLGGAAGGFVAMEKRVVESPNWDDGRHTCALDVAEEGPATVEQIGRYLGISHVAVVKVIQRAIRKAAIGSK